MTNRGDFVVKADGATALLAHVTAQLVAPPRGDARVSVEEGVVVRPIRRGVDVALDVVIGATERSGV